MYSSNFTMNSTTSHTSNTLLSEKSETMEYNAQYTAQIQCLPGAVILILYSF